MAAVIIAGAQGLKTAGEFETLNPLRHAVSHDTLTVAEHVAALLNQRSPSSLEVAPRALSKRALDEQLFDALARVKVLTSQVAMHLDRNWRDKLFRQLDSLVDPAEWEPGDEPVREGSFATFLKAMLAMKPIRRPGLGLSHMGNLIGAWTRDTDRLTMEFMPQDKVRWVLARHCDGDIERYAGHIAVTRLGESLSPYHPEHWLEYGQQPTR